MFVIVAVATDTRAVGAAAAIAIGATVGLDALFGGPVTGASMNPARSFGPALVANQWHDFWIYVSAPVAGALLGALAYQAIRGADHEPAKPQRRVERRPACTSTVATTAAAATTAASTAPPNRRGPARRAA